MIISDSRPQFAVYVAWHADFVLGGRIDKHLRRHWSTDPYCQIVGDGGVDVLPRHARVPSDMPPIDWDGSNATAVVVLMDRLLAAQPAWVDYVRKLGEEADDRGFARRVFPVAMEAGVLDAFDAQLRTQAHRWDAPTTADSDPQRRLILDLLHQFCRMLRYRLRPESGQSASVSRYLKERVRVFISYSQHDEHGKAVADGIHKWIRGNSDLGTFFDVVDIPSGVSFEDAIDDAIPECALVACYSDSYSSREWCRREVVAAKRHGVPMVVVDCLRDMDPRLFPYLGNVPALRVAPEQAPRTEQVATMLLDEVFRDLLWRCRVAPLRHEGAGVAFTSRKPELCSLAALPASQRERPLVVYPGPPIGAEEETLFTDIKPDMQLQTFDNWTRSHA